MIAALVAAWRTARARRAQDRALFAGLQRAHAATVALARATRRAKT